MNLAASQSVRDSAQGLGPRFNDILMPCPAEPTVWPWWVIAGMILILLSALWWRRHQRNPHVRLERLSRSLETGKRDPRTASHDLARLMKALETKPDSTLMADLDQLRFGPEAPQADELRAIIQQCRSQA